MFDAYARIWVYVPWKETLDQQNVNLSRIERVVDFQGDLFRLEDQIRQHLRQLAPRWSDTRATCRQSAQASLEANVVRRMEGWHALFDSAFPLAQLQMAILTATSLDRPP